MKMKKRIQGVLLILCLGASVCCIGCSSSKMTSVELKKASENESQGEVKNKESVGSQKKKEIVTSGEAVSNQTIVVYVCGAVNCPGVYTLGGSARMADAVAAAGGMTPEADANVLNLAQFLTDGQMIRIPLQGEVSVLAAQEEQGMGETQSGQHSDGKVNINTADSAQLMTIPGVGQAKADAIIRYREEQGTFQKTEDVMQVEGIKEGSFSKMKDYICVE